MVNYITNIALPPLKKELEKRFQFQHLKYMDLTEDWNGEFIRHSFCSTDHLIFCFIHLFDCLFQNSLLQKVFWTKTSLNTFFFLLCYINCNIQKKWIKCISVNIKTIVEAKWKNYAMPRRVNQILYKTSCVKNILYGSDNQDILYLNHKLLFCSSFFASISCIFSMTIIFYDISLSDSNNLLSS